LLISLFFLASQNSFQYNGQKTTSNGAGILQVLFDSQGFIAKVRRHRSQLSILLFLIDDFRLDAHYLQVERDDWPCSEREFPPSQWRTSTKVIGVLPMSSYIRLPQDNFDSYSIVNGKCYNSTEARNITRMVNPGCAPWARTSSPQFFLSFRFDLHFVFVVISRQDQSESWLQGCLSSSATSAGSFSFAMSFGLQFTASPDGSKTMGSVRLDSSFVPSAATSFLL